MFEPEIIGILSVAIELQSQKPSFGLITISSCCKFLLLFNYFFVLWQFLNFFRNFFGKMELAVEIQKGYKYFGRSENDPNKNIVLNYINLRVEHNSM